MDDHRTASAIHSIWWQVALGGFLALCAHSLVEAAYARYQIQQATKELEAELKAMPAPFRAPTAGTEQERTAPLRANERCITGRRFERVENGWKQVNEPC